MFRCSSTKLLITVMGYSFVVTSAVMFVYELIKEYTFNDLTKWQSHIVTIVFTSLLSAAVSFFISRRFIFYSTRLKEENNKLVECNKVINGLISEKNILLREVHHRLKNNMSTVHSILLLQARTAENPEAIKMIEDAASRVKSMAILYDKLYCSEILTSISLSGYLPVLIDEIVSNFLNSTFIKIEKDIEDFELDGEKLQTLGILINELFTNIMKYAFEGRENGFIYISARLKDDLVSVVIHDNGNGMPEFVDFNEPHSFGLLIVKSLVDKLSGEISIERIEGTKLVLEFKI